MRYLIPFFVIGFLVSCKQDITPEYPHCFAELESTHPPYTTFGGGVYIQLSDTSALLVGLHDKTLGIGTTCTELQATDLTDGSGISYVEWSLYPDSVPPDLTGDVIYPNTSTSRWWTLSSGDITAIVSKSHKNREPSEFFQLSLRIKNGIVDRSADGLPNITFEDIIVKNASTLGYF